MGFYKSSRSYYAPGSKRYCSIAALALRAHLRNNDLANAWDVSGHATATLFIFKLSHILPLKKIFLQKICETE